MDPEENTPGDLYGEEDMTIEQWALIEKSGNEIKQGPYHSYDQVKAHFNKWLGNDFLRK